MPVSPKVENQVKKAPLRKYAQIFPIQNSENNANKEPKEETSTLSRERPHNTKKSHWPYSGE